MKTPIHITMNTPTHHTLAHRPRVLGRRARPPVPARPAAAGDPEPGRAGVCVCARMPVVGRGSCMRARACGGCMSALGRVRTQTPGRGCMTAASGGTRVLSACERSAVAEHVRHVTTRHRHTHVHTHTRHTHTPTRTRTRRRSACSSICAPCAPTCSGTRTSRACRSVGSTHASVCTAACTRARARTRLRLQACMRAWSGVCTHACSV